MRAVSFRIQYYAHHCDGSSGAQRVDVFQMIRVEVITIKEEINYGSSKYEAAS